MLIPPDVLFEMLFTKEYPSFLHSLFPSVPERTRRNVFSKKIKPRQKTISAIFNDLSKVTTVSTDEIRKICTNHYTTPWRLFFEAVKVGAREGYPQSFDYAFNCILQAETGLYLASKAKLHGDSHWYEHFLSTCLPPQILSEEFMGSYRTGKAGQLDENGNAILPCKAGNVVLSVSLYLLAALERSLARSELVRNHALWIHRKLPYLNGENPIEPMHIFFKKIMSHMGISSIAELARKLPSLTKRRGETDPESQRRQINRWMSGESPPSWETIRMIRDTFFNGDNGILASYGVSRFLQSLYTCCRDQLLPVYFENEQALVNAFQEYRTWQNYHEAR